MSDKVTVRVSGGKLLLEGDLNYTFHLPRYQETVSMYLGFQCGTLLQIAKDGKLWHIFILAYGMGSRFIKTEPHPPETSDIVVVEAEQLLWALCGPYYTHRKES